MAAYPSYPSQQPAMNYEAADIDPEDKAWENERPYLNQRLPRPPQRLNIFDVVCIISNRMIGERPPATRQGKIANIGE